MKDTDGNIASSSSVSTENICGMIFDTAGFTDALGTGTAATTFANGNVVELNTTDDLKESGIDASVMCGLPYYHIKQYFTLAGENQRLFVSFMDSSKDADFEAIELMQTAADGIIYQIAVWTTKPSAQTGEDGNLVVTKLYTTLQTVAETLGGKINTVNYDGNSPVNILLNAPVTEALTVDYKTLPDASLLDLPKVSHILGQESSAEVHAIQAALIEALGGKMAVVGNVGAILGVLSVAPAEVSVAYVKDYNLSGAMQSCELGFGEISYDADKVDVSKSSFNNVKSITYTKRQNYLHSKGYMFLTPIEGIQGGIFFSSDQTLSTGDYRSISRCRVMHKSRRVVRQALLTKVNAPVVVDTSTGYMSSSDITIYQNLVLEALDNNMVEPGTTTSQISGRSCNIDSAQNILENDQLQITYSLVPVGCTAAIFVTEGFAGSISD